jgi:heme exporter protein D
MTVTENPPERRTQWPADYYSSGAPKPVLPRWAPFGCGAASVVVLILVFAGGALLSSGGFTSFMDLAIGMSVSEMKGQYAADVTAEQKKALDDEVKQLSRNLRAEKVSIQALQPFLIQLRDVSSDKKVTSAEVTTLQAVARKINSAAKR